LATLDKPFLLAWFRNLRIHSRLHLISLVLFTSTLVLGLVYFYGHKSIDSAIEIQSQYMKIYHLSNSARTAYLEMQMAEKSFLRTRDTRYVKKYKEAILEIKKVLGQTTTLTDNKTIKTYIQRFQSDVDTQATNFTLLTRLYIKQGLNENLGIQGQLRKAIHKIEQKLSAANLKALSSKMLMIRRHEKDFILRQDDKYVTRLDLRADEFNIMLNSTQLLPSVKVKLADLLETYQSKFHDFVKTTKMMSKVSNLNTLLYQQVTPGFQAILEAAVKERQQAATIVASTREKTAKILLVWILLVLLFSTGITHFIGKSIATPILKQADTVKRLATGDTSIEIPDTELNNEIGAMAQAMQVFRDNSIEHMWAMDSQQQLEKIAYFDALTGLANRAHCQKDLAETFAFAAEKDRFAIIQIDLDNFKRVNDTLGHAAGDHLLQTLGTRLNFLTQELQNLKPYRWGGDEFIVLVQRDDSTNMEDICQELTDLISVPIQFEKTTLRPTVSLGVARYPEDGQDISTLMVFADLALYKTKELGRDGYQFFTSEMKEKLDTETRIEHELRVAIDEGQLELFFQPQIDINSEVISGVEALVRWNHPERGLLAPGEFLAVAEATDLAPAMGRVVFEEAMRSIRHLSDFGLEFGRMAINLSPQHLKKKTILDDLFKAMDKYNVEPGMLAVEFLESFLLDDPNADIENVLNQLRTRGIHVELDDFGTGYASLSHLSKMPINGLKIDRSFVNHMVDDKKQQGIVSALISISKLLDLRVVCEGVETQHQLDTISQIGNCAIQGYVIARPMSLGHITDWIREKRNIGLLKDLPKTSQPVKRLNMINMS
jgi:diguanylate cyclase (GGDEF)-like protein